MVFTFSILKAQEGNVNAYYEYSNGSIKLNWSFDNVQSFENFKHYGITIKRQIFEKNHEILPYNQQVSSEITIGTSIKPQSEAWMQANLTHPKANTLISLLYNPAISDINQSNPKLIDAVNKEKADKMIHYLITFIAGQDMELAIATGLGYVDSLDIRPDYGYRYILTVTDTSGRNLIYPHYFNVETYQSTEYYMPQLRAESDINTITLKWTPTEDMQYISYDIYRSLAGQNDFQRINEEPFVFMRMTGSDDFREISYLDSIPGGVYFDYKIQGRTPIGTTSPFSDIVTEKALISPFYNFPLSYTDPVTTESECTIHWTMPDSLDTYISHFNIYRSLQQDDNYTMINASGIASNLREYHDTEALSEGFYIVEAIAVDSNFYRTIPIFTMLKDTIPPAPPTGVTAKYLDKSKVIVSWNANTEEDIFGYRVMISDSKNGNFNQITTDAVTQTEYTTYTDPEDPRDSTYFKVFAVDKRGNYSELSGSYGVKKPNIVPPAKPNLSIVKPDKEGIRLSWRYSSGKDVVRHILKRKMDGTPHWENVLIIPNSDKDSYMPTDSTDYNYIDTAALEQRPYVYRLIAETDQYVNAGSEMMTVTPMAPVFTSSIISNFAIEEEVLPSLVNPQVELELSKLKRANPRAAARFTSANGMIHNIILNWTYTLDASVQDFQIYRSITGGATTLYRTVKLAEAMGMDPNTGEVVITENMGPVNLSVKDKDLLEGRRYTYQILARHKDQSTTKLSNSLTLKIER